MINHSKQIGRTGAEKHVNYREQLNSHSQRLISALCICDPRSEEQYVSLGLFAKYFPQSVLKEEAASSHTECEEFDSCLHGCAGQDGCDSTPNT